MTFVRRYAAPLLALLIGLAGTISAALLTAQAEAGRRQARFEGLANSAVAAIENRMLGQLALLRGAAGLFLATGEVSRDDFRAYVGRLRLEQNHPGVLAIGYAAHAPDRAMLAALAAQSRTRDVPTLRLWPEGERPELSAILYLEPLNRLNRAALGYDMLSESTRRTAMLAAARAGNTRTTGKVRLVQEIDPVKQPGFLIYTPMFRSGDGTLQGWVYSPLRAYDLFGAIFARRDLTDLVVEVFDGAIGDAHLLYRSRIPQAGAGQVAIRQIDVAGRPWLIRLSSTERFDEGSPLLLGLLVGVAGTLISILFAALMLQQVRARAETEREVRVRTAELREANVRLRDEATARKDAEAQVRQMQKIEAVGQLTGGIAHDFNNMLAVIVGNLDMAERRASEPAGLARAIANARQGADKAAELTRRLLAFGRRQPLSPRVIDANQLVAGMSKLLRRTLGERVKLETVLAGGLWRAHADPAQLDNAIVNLAINGRDAMPDGGALTVETANCRLDESYVRTHEMDLVPGQYVLIAVSDTGCGMPPEIAARALEPFFTTKEVGRGTGLGLSQVYGFVKQSAGHLKIYSEPGQGTTIKIYLPRYQGSEAPVEPTRSVPDPALPRARPGETILLAEDEPRVREMSVETLRELGYRVLAASHGVAALAILDQEPDVRLLFTDVVMPEMDGRRLAEAALARRPDLKILYTTGYTPNAIVHHGRLDDGVALLQKPYSAHQLARKVRDMLDGADHAASTAIRGNS
ncbi:CHASE domain-containing protein [Allosphingosinicella deserti]|nr:CHASE domain-containing protein [Sphingomonas deserti]